MGVGGRRIDRMDIFPVETELIAFYKEQNSKKANGNPTMSINTLKIIKRQRLSRLFYPTT